MDYNDWISFSNDQETIFDFHDDANFSLDNTAIAIEWYSLKVRPKKPKKTTSLNGYFKVDPPRSFLYNRRLIPFPLVRVDQGNVACVSIHLMDCRTWEELPNTLENFLVEVKDGQASFSETRLGKKITSNKGKHRSVIEFCFRFKLWNRQMSLDMSLDMSLGNFIDSHSFMIFSKEYLMNRAEGLDRAVVDNVFSEFGITNHHNIVVIKGEFPIPEPVVRFGLDIANLLNYERHQLIVETPKCIFPCVVPILIDGLESGKTYSFIDQNDQKSLIAPPNNNDVSLKDKEHFADMASGDYNQPLKELNLVKVLVLGKELVGKTTLVKRIVGRWKSESGPIQTGGIEIAQWKPKGIENTIIHFWDFADRELYYATYDFFLTWKGINLIVFDCRQSMEENELLSWLNSILTKAPTSQVMIVGSFMDWLSNLDQIGAISDQIESFISEWQEHMPSPNGKPTFVRHLWNGREVAFWPLNCIGPSNSIESFCERLVDTIRSMDTEKIEVKVTQMVEDVSWQNRGGDTPILSNEEFNAFIRLKLSDQALSEQACDQIKVQLANCGFLLIVRNLVVLKPQWLAGTFKPIISTKSDESQAGILSLKQIKIRLKQMKLSEPTCEQLISIWEDLGACISHPAFKANFIIPSLLDETRPEMIDEKWEEEKGQRECVGRAYKVPCLPYGLFDGVLLKIGGINEVFEFWKNGLLCKDKESFLLLEIETDKASRVSSSEYIITIQATGEHRAELILKAHIIVMDFLVDRMPGILDRLTIAITYQKVGGRNLSILAERATEMMQNYGEKPFVGFDTHSPEIVLPEYYKTVDELSSIHKELNCRCRIDQLFFIDLKASITLPPLYFFPHYVTDIPAKAAYAIIQQMDFLPRNWKAFAGEVWPSMSIREMSRFEVGGMEAVLQKMASEGETTSKLFQTLIKIGRRDLISALQKDYPSLSIYL